MSDVKTSNQTGGITAGEINVEPKPVTSQDFQNKYEALCKEMGYIIIPTLTWIPRDDGTFSTKCNLTIGELPRDAK
jgi:hypothetical protein